MEQENTELKQKIERLEYKEQDEIKLLESKKTDQEIEISTTGKWIEETVGESVLYTKTVRHESGLYAEITQWDKQYWELGDEINLFIHIPTPSKDEPVYNIDGNVIKQSRNIQTLLVNDITNRGIIQCSDTDELSEFKCMNILTGSSRNNHFIIDDNSIFLVFGEVQGNFVNGIYDIDVSYNDGSETHKVTLSLTIQ